MNWSFEITKQVMAAIVRWALATLGTFLVTKGIVDPALADAFISEWTGIVVGVMLIAAAAMWKWLNARYNILALMKAVYAEPPSTQHGLERAIEEVKEDVKQSPIKTLPY